MRDKAIQARRILAKLDDAMERLEDGPICKRYGQLYGRLDAVERLLYGKLVSKGVISMVVVPISYDTDQVYYGSADDVILKLGASMPR